MSKDEIDLFLGKDISDQLLEFYEFSFEKKMDIFQYFDLEKKKTFLNQMSINELKKFIITTNFDSNIVNLVSFDKVKTIFESIDNIEEKIFLLKNIQEQKSLFSLLSNNDKKNFLFSLSFSELEDFIYSDNISMRDAIQVLGYDYIKTNVANISFRAARDVMAVVDADILKKESDIRVLEGKIEKLKNKKNNDNVFSSMTRELNIKKNDVNNLKELLGVSQESHKANRDKLTQEISNFSKICSQLRSSIPKDNSNFRRISRLMSAEQDIVMHLSRFGIVSDSFFNNVTQNLSSEEKQVFLEFKNKVNSIMSGNGKEENKEEHKEENKEEHKEEKKEEEKKVSRKSSLPKMKDNVSFEKYIVDAVMEAYHNAGYGKNANGWYFDPSSDEYVEGYNPIYDSLFNAFIRSESRQAAMEAYRNAGYGKNAYGWYFDPSSNEYVEGYDPSLDSMFNLSILKHINQNENSKNNRPQNGEIKNSSLTYSKGNTDNVIEKDGQNFDGKQSKTSETVKKIVNYLNQNQEKFGATFISSDDLKNADSVTIDEKPIISLSEVDKKIFMEFVGWKNTKKDSKKIDKTYDKIKSFIKNSKEFGVTFVDYSTFYSLPSLVSIKEEQGIVSLTDEEKKVLQHSVIYQIKLEEQHKLDQNHGRSRVRVPNGNVSYQFIIGSIIIVVLFILFLVLI